MVKGSKHDSVASVKSGTRVTVRIVLARVPEGVGEGDFQSYYPLFGTVWQTCGEAGLCR